MRDGEASVSSSPRFAVRGASFAPSPSAMNARHLPGPAWIFAFTITQIACQLALLVRELAPARVVFRSASFGVSLLFLSGSFLVGRELVPRIYQQGEVMEMVDDVERDFQ